MKIKLLLIILLFLFGCKKDKPEPPEDIKPPEELTKKHAVLITNEGNFQWGNASVSLYDLSDSKITEDVFMTANQRPLGDVCQSLSFINGRIYIVVNNSGKIEVVNADDFKSVATITGLKSPRYIKAVSLQKAYVTDFKSDTVSVIDLNTNTVIKHIRCPGFTEQLETAAGKAFITNIHREYVYVVNTSTDNIEDSIKVNYGSNSIVKDRDGKLWVISGGNSQNGIKPALQKINPQNNQIELKLETTAAGGPRKITINGTGDTLYWLQQGVWQLPVISSSLPSAPLISSGNLVFYGLGAAPESGNIYVSDAIDYVQKGKVMVYSQAGQFLYSFNAGINPGHFYFRSPS
jgi:DNA-binding beta-propeller fold protein YncE